MLRLEDLLKKTVDQIWSMNISLSDLERLQGEARDRARALVTRAEDNGTDLQGDDAATFDDLATVAERVSEVITEIRDRAQRANALVGATRGAGGLTIDRGLSGAGNGGGYDRDAIREPGSVEDYRTRSGRDPWNLSEIRTLGRDSTDLAAELRGRALSAIENMRGASDKVRQAATSIIEEFDDKDSSLARQALITSSPAYLRAWTKLANGRQATLTAEESQAVDAANSLQRAMSLTDANGGYLVPFQLDPTVIITSAGSQNDIRQFARQVVATGDKWHGVSAGAVSWSWDGEATEVSDDSPTFAQPEIDIFKAQGFVPISIEAIADAANATEEVAKLLAFGKDELEAQAFVTGNGTTQPEGIITGLDGTSAEMNATTAETFQLADVHALRSALPARHRKNGAWLANDLIYSQIRQFDTSGGAGLWEYLGADRPDMLLGKPVGEAEAMDGTINPAVTADNFLLVFGAFSHGYVVADRLGMAVELVPHLFGANRRPTGQRGWYAHYRTGAGVVDPGAFKMLNIATTA
ncbi:phage major capsid protein [Gordonia tangerina]|uniref:Phage major capsid protein n=1 Tax=Gordonia tangerina TaxID=2911060 RepID=A0ABS9DM67_9ACTN|nr:phage major capsid protein [Gordonia tangerina]MCF3939076.1 phage major capsid protein [Gordonia tangerina]